MEDRASGTATRAGEGSEGKRQDEREGKKTFVEQMEVAGSELVDRVKDLIGEGNARRVIIRDKDGRELLEAPLTFGVVAGGLITVAAPLLAAVGALAALVTRVKLEVIREIDGGESAAPVAPSEPDDMAQGGNSAG